MQLPYSEELNIEYLGRLFDKTSECYKLFWFKAIVAKVTSGKQELTYEELVDEIIRGWLEYNMILYLQKRNPSVPGIADKLYPPQERKLEKIKKYWKLIIDMEPVREIYSNKLMTDKDISIDHFVSWSYVAHDEMWNLNPTTKSINSSKSNNLPDWEKYFERLVRQEYQSYQLIWKYEQIHKEFDKCAKEHINSDEIKYRVYRQGLDYNEFSKQLQSIILPVYQSAQNCGFASWHYEVI